MMISVLICHSLNQERIRPKTLPSTETSEEHIIILVLLCNIRLRYIVM